MKTKVKKLSDTRVELTVTLDAEDIKPAEEQALENLAKEVKVEGFRKGKVPVEVAKKFIPENDLNAETVDRAVRMTVIPAFMESQKSPLVVPTVNVTKYVPGEMVEYTAVADIVPEVKIGAFKNLGVKKPEVKISAKQVDEVLDNIAHNMAEKKAVKRAAKDGDEVIIDFTGTKDGEKFEGGAAKDYPLVLGSKTFIPGFEDAIVGDEPGDKFNIELTFPEDYGVSSLAGQDVVFETLLKQVNEMTEPKLDDEFAKKVGGFESLKALKEDIKKNLAMQEEHRKMDEFRDALVTKLVEKSKVTAPEIMVEDQMQSMREDLSRNAASHKMTLEELIENAGETVDSWEKKAREVAEMRVKASLVIQTLAVEQGIKASDDEVAAKLAELREVYKKSPEALKNLKDPNVRVDIKNRLTIEKALDFLVKENS